ncbi:MAG: tetratricopeptide repeat protein [Planctomycetes bacterium]|nr:tetratricopeptide repeat protein [Planctomycetota bacterium]
MIVSAGFIAYLPSFGGQWLFDDYLQIVRNGRIRDVWHLSEFFKDTRPVVDFTFAVNFAVHELWIPGYHAVNLFIHLSSAMLLYGLVRRTLLSPAVSPECRSAAQSIAMLASLLWVVHPLGTQAVTYVVQRAESLMAMCYLLTLYCLNRAAGPRTAFAWGAAAIVAGWVGMGCKAVMVTAPSVALLYDRIFLAPSIRMMLRNRWWLHLALWSSTAMLWVVGVVGGLYQKEQGGGTTVGFAMEGITPVTYGLTQLGVILHYLRLCVWPYPLCLDYGWPLAHSVSDVALGAVVVSALVLATVWLMFKRPAAGFLGAAFFLILAPTSSIVPIKDLAFEHRMYLPLAAITVAVAIAAHRWIAKPARVVTIIAITLVFIVVTVNRNLLYGDPVRLWSQNVDLAPHHQRPRNALGYALLRAGRPAEAEGRLKEALQLDPNSPGPYANLGMVYWSQKRFAEALPFFEKALSLSPNEFGAEFFYCFGTALFELGRREKAVDMLRTAVEIFPDYPEAQYNLGNALLDCRRYDEAVVALTHAIRLSPKTVEAYVNLGLAYDRSDRINDAIAAYREGMKTLPPDSRTDPAFKCRYNLGLSLIKAGRTGEAADILKAAVAIRPDHAGAVAALRTVTSPSGPSK